MFAIITLHGRIDALFEDGLEPGLEAARQLGGEGLNLEKLGGHVRCNVLKVPEVVHVLVVGLGVEGIKLLGSRDNVLAPGMQAMVVVRVGTSTVAIGVIHIGPGRAVDGRRLECTVSGTFVATVAMAK
jgi:hypothetical protein